MNAEKEQNVSTNKIVKYGIWKKLFLSLLILTVIYSNLWVILKRSPYKTSLLPITRQTADLFDMFGVFAYYEEINREIVIKGLNEKDDWVDLQIIDRYFPFTRGARQTRLYFSKHYFNGVKAQQEACKSFATKIRKRYLKDNPQISEGHLKKVAIEAEFWPRSLKGYKAEKTPSQTSRQIVCMED